MELPYRVVISPAEEGGYVVEIPDLPGCISQGETMEEAFKMILDAKTAWIESALEDGMEIPGVGYKRYAKAVQSPDPATRALYLTRFSSFYGRNMYSRLFQFKLTANS